jgi:hypothetical protein
VPLGVPRFGTHKSAMVCRGAADCPGERLPGTSYCKACKSRMNGERLKRKRVREKELT